MAILLLSFTWVKKIPKIDRGHGKVFVTIIRLPLWGLGGQKEAEKHDVFGSWGIHYYCYYYYYFFFLTIP